MYSRKRKEEECGEKDEAKCVAVSYRVKCKLTNKRWTGPSHYKNLGRARGWVGTTRREREEHAYAIFKLTLPCDIDHVNNKILDATTNLSSVLLIILLYY